MSKLKTVKLNKSKAKKKIADAKSKNTKAFWATILMVIAANIVNGEFVFEDVDDLLGDDEQKQLKQNITAKQKEMEKLMKKAQAAEAKDKGKRAAKGNDPKAGKGRHQGR